MNVIHDVVANNGTLTPGQIANATGANSSQRQGTRFGAKLLFLSAILFPLCLALSIMIDGPAPLLLPVMTFIAGGAWLLYTRIFGEEPFNRNSKHQSSSHHLNVPPVASLPPQSNAVSGFNSRRADTGEFIEPPNVTEHTTHLLE